MHSRRPLVGVTDDLGAHVEHLADHLAGDDLSRAALGNTCPFLITKR
jgi:hypothetical protein